MPDSKASRGRRRRAPGKADSSYLSRRKSGDLDVLTAALCVATYLPPSTRKVWRELWVSSLVSSLSAKLLPL